MLYAKKSKAMVVYFHKGNRAGRVNTLTQWWYISGNGKAQSDQRAAYRQVRFLGVSGAVNIGHSNPVVLDAIRRQLDRSTFGYRLHVETEAAEALAEQTAALAPDGMEHVPDLVFPLQTFIALFNDATSAA